MRDSCDCLSPMPQPPRSVLAPEETEWGTVGESSPTLKMRKGNRWTAGSTDLVLAGHFSLQTVPEAGKTSLPHHLNSEPKGQWLGLQPCTPQRQCLPPSQSPETMDFAGRWRSLSYVTGVEARWHLSPLRNPERETEALRQHQ